MKTLTIAAVTLLAAFAHGAPNRAQVHLRPSRAAVGTATVTFEGATPEATYVQEFPLDGTEEDIGMSLGQFHFVLISIILIGPPDAKLRWENLADLHRRQPP